MVRVSFVLLCLGLLGQACGSPLDTGALRSQSKQSNSMDQLVVVSGQLSSEGSLVISNNLSSNWAGDSLLGNQKYEVEALD